MEKAPLLDDNDARECIADIRTSSTIIPQEVDCPPHSKHSPHDDETASSHHQGSSRFWSLQNWSAYIRRTLSVLSLVAILVGSYYLLNPISNLLLKLLHNSGNNWLDFLLLFGLFFVFCLILFPPEIICVIAGYSFSKYYGFTWALVIVSFFASLSILSASCFAFSITRYFLHERLRLYMKDHKRFRVFQLAVARDGIGLVFALRSSPVAPFMLLSYVFGLSDIRFIQFFLGSLGYLLTIVASTSLGASLDNLSVILGGKNSGQAIVLLIFEAIIVIVIVVLLSLRISSSMKAAAEELEGQPEMTHFVQLEESSV